MYYIAHLIKTFTRARHAELVSASMRYANRRVQAARWTLKQVQGDEGASA